VPFFGCHTLVIWLMIGLRYPKSGVHHSPFIPITKNEWFAILKDTFWLPFLSNSFCFGGVNELFAPPTTVSAKRILLSGCILGTYFSWEIHLHRWICPLILPSTTDQKCRVALFQFWLMQGRSRSRNQFVASSPGLWNCVSCWDLAYHTGVSCWDLAYHTGAKAPTLRY